MKLLQERVGQPEGEEDEGDVEEEPTARPQPPADSTGCVAINGGAHRDGESWKEGDCTSCNCQVTARHVTSHVSFICSSIICFLQ